MRPSHRDAFEGIVVRGTSSHTSCGSCRGNPTKNACLSTMLKAFYFNVCKICVREKEAQTIVQRPKTHHCPSYSQRGWQVHEQIRIFGARAPARARGAPSKTHTFACFRTAPAPPRGPPRRKKRHPPGRMRAQAFWSMADHANP